ncbi:MAG: winged helix-turn-helix transcriptional regulator [Aquincola tertiaricarbonis]|uniref:winged helix-turn-helix transcriptional regulator n=1 Tax=Aquincola TaxID=391952 RepID=UPI000614AEBE|nr:MULTISPECIES: helix-turn-helix domain-containing protein [Aquincola]MCR5867707.1 helix-turn-helix transcriptional regulator [Aquincola sp. J276]
MTTSPTTSHFVHPHHGAPLDPAVERVVREIIGRVADKWTLITLEVLTEHGRQRFTEIQRRVGPVSQKVLTQVLRGMEEDGLLVRTVYAEVPPRVEYELTQLGGELSAAFCGVWLWAERHREEIAAAQDRFARRERPKPGEQAS